MFTCYVFPVDIVSIRLMPATKYASSKIVKPYLWKRSCTNLPLSVHHRIRHTFQWRLVTCPNCLSKGKVEWGMKVISDEVIDGYDIYI